MELTQNQLSIANLKAELQTNIMVRNQQVECLELSKQLFGVEDSTYINTLESIKKSQNRIQELRQNIFILESVEPSKNIKITNKKW